MKMGSLFENERVCRQCGAVLQKDAKFCYLCGAEQAQVCPKCGAALMEGARFCSQCGVKLEEKAAEKPDVSGFETEDLFALIQEEAQTHPVKPVRSYELESTLVEPEDEREIVAPSFVPERERKIVAPSFVPEYVIKASGPAPEPPKEPSEWTRYAGWLQRNRYFSAGKSSAAGNSRYHFILTEGKLYRIDRAAGVGPDGVVAVHVTIPAIPERIAWGDGRLWLAVAADKKFSLHSMDPQTLDCREECSFSIKGKNDISIKEGPFITKDSVYFTLYTATYSFFAFDRHSREVKRLVHVNEEQYFTTRGHAADGIWVAGGARETFVYRDGRGRIPLACHPQIQPLLPLIRHKMGWSGDYTDQDVAKSILHIDFENGAVYLCGKPAMGSFFAYNCPMFRLPFGAKSVDEMVCCWKGPHDASRAARGAHSVSEVGFPPDVGTYAYFSGKYAVAPVCLGIDYDYVYITGQGSVIDLGALDLLCDTAGLIDDVFYGEQRCSRDGVEPGWKQIVLSEAGPAVRPIVFREEAPDGDEADFTLEDF